MARITLTTGEQVLLEKFRDLGADDDSGAWAWYYPPISQALAAAGRNPEEADAMCRNLRQRKLLDGQGRGRHASYWITDKGKAALDGSA